MSDKVYNPGFGFYKNFWEAIENLPLEEQKNVCYAVVKYGITNEIISSGEYPIAYALLTSWKASLDGSIERWIQNEQKSSVKKDAVISREEAIQDGINRGLSLKEIAVEIGMSESTVKRSSAWQNRKKTEVKNSSNEQKKLSCEEDSERSKNSSKQVKNELKVKNEPIMDSSKMNFLDQF